MKNPNLLAAGAGFSGQIAFENHFYLCTMDKENQSMKQHDHAQETRATEAEQRQPWIKPVVQKMKAGDAEVGTRADADGTFTTT